MTSSSKCMSDRYKAQFCLGKILEVKGLHKNALQVYESFLSENSSSCEDSALAEETRRRIVRLKMLSWD